MMKKTEDMSQSYVCNMSCGISICRVYLMAVYMANVNEIPSYILWYLVWYLKANAISKMRIADISYIMIKCQWWK